MTEAEMTVDMLLERIAFTRYYADESLLITGLADSGKFPAYGSIVRDGDPGCSTGSAAYCNGESGRS